MFINNNLKIEEIISAEVKRLSDKYNKDYFDYQDLMKVTSLGRDNVLKIMDSKSFPLLKVGKRKVVSVVGFVKWIIENDKGGLYG
jgi:thiol-disulfide isomerase/thioredoxin